MKIPDVRYVLTIGAEPVHVVWADAEYLEATSGEDWDGCVYGFSSSFPQYVSYVNQDLPPRTQASTSLHELLHNISAIFDIGLSEQKVRILEQALCQVLSHKDYAKYLISNLAKS